MSLPSPLPLDDFERAIQDDPEVLGMFYFGSLGRGAATRHSDLDIFVVVPDSMTEPYQEKLVPLLQLFGEIHWLLIPKAPGSSGRTGPRSTLSSRTAPSWSRAIATLARP